MIMNVERSAMRPSCVAKFLATAACGLGLSGEIASGAPRFSVGTSVQGVVAYQDSEEASQFHYLPMTMETLLGERIKTFKVTHYGIGKSYFVQSAGGEITSRAGAIVSGTIKLDILETQRQALVAQIAKDFGVQNPKLLPLKLTDVQIESTMLDKALSFNEGLEQKLPSTIQIGADVAFSVGSQNSGFGHLAAARQIGGDITPNPHFGINIVAKAEFQGDPWTAEISCNLSKVWEQVRTKASVSVSAGWFRLGSATYSKIAQELKDSGACTFDMKEGSLDTEKYGRQVMDMVKKIFEEINKLAVDGEGFFKFDTNYPQADVPSGGGGSSLFGFSVSVNGGYSSAHYKQEKTWKTKVSYTGRFKSDVALSSILAVNCGPETKKFFQDLNDASESCVTQAKAELLKQRLAKEGEAKGKKYLQLLAKLEDGKITPEQYDKLKALYDRMSLTEFVAGFTTINVASKLTGTDAKPQTAIDVGLTDELLARLEQNVLAQPGRSR
jgi:hypothetical protein